MDRSPRQMDMEIIEDGDNVASNVEVLSEQPVEQMEASEESVHNSESHRHHYSQHRRSKAQHADTTRQGKKTRSRGLQFHLTTPEKMNLDYKSSFSSNSGSSLNRPLHKGDLHNDKGVRARVSPTSDYHSERSTSSDQSDKRVNDARQAFHARIFPQFVVPKLTTAPSDKFDDAESDRAATKGKSKRVHGNMNAALHKVARKEQQVDVVTNDKGPIRTSVIVAPATSPRQQDIIEIVDVQDTSTDGSASLHLSQAAQTLVPRSPTSNPMTMRQTSQPLRAGDAEQQTNPAAKNSEQVIQLDKQSWDQLPPLYKYMIQMRVIEEQQQLQMAAQQMQGQQRQQQPIKPSLPLPQQQPPVSQLQPNFLQNLALQTQMFNMFQAQLANQNLLPQVAGKFPLVATTAAAIPIVTTAGVIPSFPANFMVTPATSGSATAQEATVVASTSSVSMETSSNASEPSTSVASSNSKSHDNKKHQRNNKINDTTNYRVNQPPESPEETSDENSGKIPGDRSGPHDVLLRVSEAHLGTLQDEDGDTPLHLAVIQENFKLVQYLVKLITSVYMSLDIANNLRQTPLHLAVITHQPHMVSLLVQAGANVNFPDRHGSSSVHLAAQRRDLKCLQALAMATNPLPDFNLRNFDGLTPVHIATKEACIDVLRFLFQMGANKNALDATSGRTALHYAVELENFMLVNFLMESGVDANATTFAGNTPLHVASGRKMKEIVAVLMAYGANPGIANYEGDLPSGLPPPSLVMARMKKYKKDN